jgi:hypothetical protein
MNRALTATCALALAVLAGCSTTPADGVSDKAPPDTITPYASTAPPEPPEQVAKDNRALTRAAMPTGKEVPGFAAARPKQATLMLCPTLAKTVPGSITQAYDVWSGRGANAGRTLAVTVVLDPAKAPADSMLATLLPQDCAVDANGMHYVYDRQPQERSDGWEGVLNTIVATDTRTGKHSYSTAYLMSKGDALVNVVASRAGRDRFDPSVDEAAAHYLDLVLGRFAV